MSGFEWLKPAELSTVIINAVKAKHPFSMLRFGDGEYEICKHICGKADRDVFYARFARWFGKQEIPYQQMCGIADAVCQAFQGCDLVGIPCFREAYGYPKWIGVEGFMRDRNMYPKPAFYFYDIYTLWRDFDTFKHILTGRKDLYTISSRDVAEGLQKRYKVHNVHQFLLCPEYFLWKGTDAGVAKFITEYKGSRHYPERYTEIMQWIRDNAPLNGKLFLVGAGALGKIYCHEIRKCGGMALDIGAMFDGWAGVTTRPYLQPGDLFKL